MEYSDTLVLQVADQQVSNPLPEGAVILNLRDGVYYTLNELGALIWDYLQQPLSIGTLRDAILDEYDVSPEQLQADLMVFINRLLEIKLIEVVHDQPG